MTNNPIYDIEIDFLGDIPEKLNLPREKVAEMAADFLIEEIRKEMSKLNEY